jgi:hypothetical protein
LDLVSDDLAELGVALVDHKELLIDELLLVCTAFEVIIGEVLVRGVFVGFLLEDIVDGGLRLLWGGLRFKWI